MMFTELFVPKGAHTREELDQLAQRLTTHGLHDSPHALSEPAAERADPGVLEFLESITHVVVHEVDVWIAGGRRQDAGAVPRYVVRVYVPGPWRKPLSEHLIARITRALADAQGDPGRLYERPDCEVHVLGVPDGGYGAFGRVIDDSILMDMISDATSGIAEVPEGMGVDPVCGTTVSMTEPGAVTAEVDGVTFQFCCPQCRGTFLKRQRNKVAGE
ncbi:hypothetical protein [Mycobacterium neumannii]|uniref:hypothetical protein n=1 Tax=Mycobacterium neumannii TaxID=2048551 RepID=UPI003AB91836